MSWFDGIISKDYKTAAVVGHVRPDGDCSGAVTAVFSYLKEMFPDITVTPYLEELTDNLVFLEEEIPVERVYSGQIFDLCIAVDCSDVSRIGAGKEAFLNALHTACIDHHKTNQGIADVNLVRPEASSTCEVLYDLFDKDHISVGTAIRLYTGIIHDTGVFQYDCTSAATLRAAADLIEKGFDFASVIRDSLVLKPFTEARMIADVITRAVFLPEEQFIYAIADKAFQEKYGLTARDLGAVVSEMNEIKGAEVTLFVYEIEDGTFKGSLRSKEKVDVSKIAAHFGGGGHEKAAGFSIETDPKGCVTAVRQLLKNKAGQS